MSPLLSFLFSLLGSSVAGFFGRFLGSEGTAIMTRNTNLVLFAILILGFIFFYRRVCLRWRKKHGFRLVLVLFLYFSCLLLISLFGCFLRIYLVETLGLHLGHNFPFLLILCVGGVEGFPHSVEGDGSGASSSNGPPFDFDLNFPKASEHEKEAGVGEQVSVEAQPQGESSSKCEAGPSSRKEEKALNLNIPLHPREATHELLNDQRRAEEKIDELMERAPSLRNARDLDAWGRELQEVAQFFAETEQRLKWAIENEKEMYAAQDEEWAKAKADLHSQIELSFPQKEAAER